VIGKFVDGDYSEGQKQDTFLQHSGIGMRVVSVILSESSNSCEKVDARVCVEKVINQFALLLRLAECLAFF
jgi:hypothetical protein